MFTFLQDELEAKKSLKTFFFTAYIITKYSSERFLSSCGEKMSKRFLNFCKLKAYIIPDTNSDHCVQFYKRALIKLAA